MVDSGAMSTVGKPGDKFIPTDKLSQKLFEIPTGEETKAITKANFHHKVVEPARTVDMVLNLALNSLLSTSTLSDTKYVTVLTPEYVLMFHDLGHLQLTISQEATLKGWRCKTSGFWRVPLKTMVINQKKDTILLYRPNPEHAVNSAYEFPITEELIRYLHECAVYPTKETWVKSIIPVNYVLRPGLNVKKVKK